MWARWAKIVTVKTDWTDKAKDRAFEDQDKDYLQWQGLLLVLQESFRTRNNIAGCHASFFNACDVVGGGFTATVECAQEAHSVPLNYN